MKLYRRIEQAWRAHAAVRKAIKEGRLVREPCSICGAVEVEAHHWDYDQPLEVQWLCRRHHALAHARIQRHLMEMEEEDPIEDPVELNWPKSVDWSESQLGSLS